MNEQWQNFLQQIGASIEGDMVSGFADISIDFTNIKQTNILADLSHRGLLRVSGDDAEGFLQGQFCNDVRAVNDSHSQLSAYCTPKGRILASFRLFKMNSDYYLSMPRGVLDATLKRLRMFILRSQVTIEDISIEIVQFGISGPDAGNLLLDALGTVPETTNQAVTQDGITCIKTRSEIPAYEFYGTAAQMQSLWQKLASDCQPIASHYWTWLDIQAGLPSITTPVVEAFVPQMINLHWIDGLSFKKGCYPGQEIVARTHYLGKLKRRMYLAHVDSETCPGVGDEVHRLEDPQGQSAGKVLLSHPAPQGGCDLLVVMQIDAVASGEIIANRNIDSKLQFSELPYSVDDVA